ncbi:hypothetical protein ACLOJK_000548 [Asimina triloba]
MDTARSKCIPRAIKAASIKYSHSRTETMRLPISDGARNSSAGADSLQSASPSVSKGGSKRITDPSRKRSSKRLDYKENEKLIKIEEIAVENEKKGREKKKTVASAIIDLSQISVHYHDSLPLLGGGLFLAGEEYGGILNRPPISPHIRPQLRILTPKSRLGVVSPSSPGNVLPPRSAVFYCLTMGGEDFSTPHIDPTHAKILTEMGSFQRHLSPSSPGNALPQRSAVFRCLLQHLRQPP